MFYLHYWLNDETLYSIYITGKHRVIYVFELDPEIYRLRSWREPNTELHLDIVFTNFENIIRM